MAVAICIAITGKSFFALEDMDFFFLFLRYSIPYSRLFFMGQHTIVVKPAIPLSTVPRHVSLSGLDFATNKGLPFAAVKPARPSFSLYFFSQPTSSPATIVRLKTRFSSSHRYKAHWSNAKDSVKEI